MVLLLKSDELANYLKMVEGRVHYKKIINLKKNFILNNRISVKTQNITKRFIAINLNKI